MSIELKVPAVGESVSEIYIGKWYKSEGDSIAADEGLVELESDKATLDVPAPSSGVLTKILKQTGDTAEVGEVIAHIDNTDGAAKSASKDASAAAPERVEKSKGKGSNRSRSPPTKPNLLRRRRRVQSRRSASGRGSKSSMKSQRPWARRLARAAPSSTIWR